MSTEAHDMGSESPTNKLKLAEVGPEKNGKSRLAATGRKPVLVHDFDNRAEALAGIPGVYVISYRDPQWPKQPEAAQELLTNLTKLEDGADLATLDPKLPKGIFPKTNVLDSIATCAKSFERYALYGSKELRREVTFGQMKVFFRKGWDATNSEMESIDNVVLRLLALSTDTIIILHETAEKAPDSTPEEPKFTGKIGVYPPRYKMLLKYFNEVWRVKLTQVSDGNKGMRYLPRVYPLPTYEFDSATALLLDPVEDPNIESLLLKHEARLKATQPVALVKK